MRRAEVPEPTVCIQLIRTMWTKQSRGGSGAVARNNVPEVMSLPEVARVSDSLTVLMHRLVYQERGDFFERKDSFEIGKAVPVGLPGVRVTHAGNDLRVNWEYHRGLGTPERPSIPAAVLVLPRGQWGRVLFNGRHGQDEGGWWYERWVYNIGLFTPLRRDVFVATEPMKVFPMMAPLW